MKDTQWENAIADVRAALTGAADCAIALRMHSEVMAIFYLDMLLQILTAQPLKPPDGEVLDCLESLVEYGLLPEHGTVPAPGCRHQSS